MNLFINCCAGRPPNSQDVNAANGGEGGGAAAAAAAAAGEDVDGHFVFPNSIEEGFKDIFGWMAENDDDMPKIRNMNELKTLYDVDWSPQGFLGKGHFATVHVGYDKRRQRKVAVKRIARSKTRMDTLKTEIRALLKVSGHPNIVELYDVFYDSVYVILVLEFLAGGELFTRIVKGGAYTERDASIHIRKIASALQYMHRRGVVHRDLKPENLVLKEATLDSEIKISDFGLSKLLRQDELYMSTVCGTRAYSSPEVNFGARGIEKKNTQYTYKVDTWSLGVILYVILAAFVSFIYL
jgi:serine/threonine protein kinase